MKKLFALILAMVILTTYAISAFAEGGDFDITVDTTRVNELGVPTKNSVAAMKETADGYWNAKDYANAAPAYAIYAKNANWLANIIAAIDEPYYSATSKKRDSFIYNSDMFIPASNAETSANSYKEQRNRAMTREAMCYYYLGDYTSAIPLLIKALDLIDIEDVTNWKMCADAINDIISK